jgi:4-hydroxy-3-methylbut-2-en-1-yl diphosphate synthase IspG/GcpE
MLIWLLVIAGVVILDQGSKALVMYGLGLDEVGESIPLIENVFHFTHVRNTGAAFGMLGGENQRWIFIVASVIGIGALLLRGIGDTLRVSLSADTEREVIAAKTILSALNLKNDCAKIVACPTCGRCEWDCMGFAKIVEDYVKDVDKPIKIAVMGCPVNGPGEAADADVGVAGSKDGCYVFKKGKILKRVEKAEIKKAFFEEIDKCLQ